MQEQRVAWLCVLLRLVSQAVSLTILSGSHLSCQARLFFQLKAWHLTIDMWHTLFTIFSCT
ncbi:hypothetical protein PVAP13_2KG203341 [Panicum virgatum]|uniref:Uncharacterized protein n=1 Tax=Panicum virgatum TaxID=38727 RepID=A0A8T0WIM5_PANVG|nr:hypothetical protein PVAP13_2KG203341 [Panicum virgatum]